MKVVVQKPFKYKGEVQKKGKELEMSEDPAKNAMEKGYVESKDEAEEEKEKIPEVDTGVGVSEDEDPWDKLDEARKNSGTLPPKWNPSQGNPTSPEPNPLRGIVTRRGEGPNGPFIVVEEKGSDEEHTVWQHTALKALINSVKPRDKVSIKFEGKDTNPNGQTYLNYTAGALKPDNSRRILNEPEED